MKTVNFIIIYYLLSKIGLFHGSFFILYFFLLFCKKSQVRRDADGFLFDIARIFSITLNGVSF